MESLKVVDQALLGISSEQISALGPYFLLVGGALLARVKKFAVETGAAYVTLETAADNSAARQLYEQNGYQESREFLHYELLL